MRVLVVDDDADLRTSLRRALSLDGHEVLLAADGRSALTIVLNERPDGIVLDMGLPDIEGLEVCRRIRAASDTTPILILTARADTADRVRGLDAGADDYLAKPFEVPELLARVRAILRRSQGRVNAQGLVENRLMVGDLVLDRDARSVTRGARAIELTRREFALLELLMEHPGRVQTRERILAEVWGDDFGLSSATLDSYVSYLRKKIEHSGDGRLIHTVRGIGFVVRQDSPK